MSASSKELAGTGHASGPSTPGDAGGVDLEEPSSEAESVAAPDAGGQPPDVEAILSSVRETAYRWDFKSDRIDWAPNAAAVLAVADPAKIAQLAERFGYHSVWFSDHILVTRKPGRTRMHSAV